MPASFRILNRHGIVYVRYSGHISLDNTLEVFGKYMQHPDRAAGQKHLVDFSDITGWDAEYVEMMAMQAKKAEAFLGHAAQTLIVYYAPTELGQSIAQLAVNSWEPFPAVVPTFQDTEEAALSILGVDHKDFAELLDQLA